MELLAMTIPRVARALALLLGAVIGVAPIARPAPALAQSGPVESRDTTTVPRARSALRRARIVADSAVVTVSSDSGRTMIYAETPGGAFRLVGDSATVAAWGATAEHLAAPEIDAKGVASLNGAVIRAPGREVSVMRLLRLSTDSMGPYQLAAANRAWQYNVQLRPAQAEALFRALREGGGDDPATDPSLDELALGDSPDVIQPAWPSKGNRSPRYPLVRGDAQMEGKVLLQFVVEPDGRPRPSSVLLVSSTEPRFALAARDALLGWHYEPARRNGVPIPRLVCQQFTFRLE
jgi:TonB family protein